VPPRAFRLVIAALAPSVLAAASISAAIPASAAAPTLTLSPASGSLTTAFALSPASGGQCAPTADHYEAYYIASSAATSDAAILADAHDLASSASATTSLTGPLPTGNVVPALSASWVNTATASIFLTDGQWQIGVLCFQSGTSTVTNDWFTTVTFTGVTAGSPNWSVSSSTTTPVGTSTVLTASPSSPAAHGSAETLSAAVTAASGSAVPAGSVDFKDGTTDLGTATVDSSGVATLTQTLADGSHSLTATFTPADATAFSASTSAAVGYTVNPAQSQLGSGSESVTVTIPRSTGAGSFSLTVPSTPAALTVSADGTSAAGSLAPVSVSDTRASSTGWTVSGQASDFTSAGGDSIPGDALGWTPSASGTTGAAVTAGPAVAPGSPGLGSAAATLGSSTGDSTATLGAGLDLAIPSGQASGTYTSTITITAI
jgi:Bacterial Ig-like domain (group 3)